MGRATRDYKCSLREYPDCPFIGWSSSQRDTLIRAYERVQGNGAHLRESALKSETRTTIYSGLLRPRYRNSGSKDTRVPGAIHGEGREFRGGMRKAFITGLPGKMVHIFLSFCFPRVMKSMAFSERASVFTTQRIDHLFNHPHFHTYHGDLADSSNLHRLVYKVQPEEIYNPGAQSHVAVSFEVPEYTAEVDAIGTIRLLDAIRDMKIPARFYQASTSEMFGGVPGTAPQSETTPFHPMSPYGAAKLYAYWVSVNYRESYGMYVCNGILFNHESPRRGETFVTKKITKAVANIQKGKQELLTLGNLDAMRDWGYAKDYVEAMWLMLQKDKPSDYVIATGQTHSVRQFVEFAFEEIGVTLQWKGSGAEERGIDTRTGKTVVKIDPRYFRPSEVELLQGNPQKAKRDLGWQARKLVRELCREMVRYDQRFDTYGGKED